MAEVALLQRERWALPIWLTPRNKYPAVAMMWLFAAVSYLLANHYPIFEPKLLPMFWVDRVVPFIPQTIWIYLSEYFFFATIFVFFKDMVNANKYIYSFVALQCVSVAIFFLWPTTYPRELFPLIPAEMDRWTYYAFSYLRSTDSPTNCAPSLHVSSVYLSSFIYLDDQREKFFLFFLWGTAIAVSTLTTKQHYLVDVISGFLMAVLFYKTFHRYVPFRQAKR